MWDSPHVDGTDVKWRCYWPGFLITPPAPLGTKRTRPPMQWWQFDPQHPRIQGGFNNEFEALKPPPQEKLFWSQTYHNHPPKSVVESIIGQSRAPTLPKQRKLQLEKPSFREKCVTLCYILLHLHLALQTLGFCKGESCMPHAYSQLLQGGTTATSRLLENIKQTPCAPKLIVAKAVC